MLINIPFLKMLAKGAIFCAVKGAHLGMVVLLCCKSFVLLYELTTVDNVIFFPTKWKVLVAPFI